MCVSDCYLQFKLKVAIVLISLTFGCKPVIVSVSPASRHLIIVWVGDYIVSILGVFLAAGYVGFVANNLQVEINNVATSG